MANFADRRIWEHLYFAAAAFALLVIVVAGFSRSYILPGLLWAPLPSALVQVHAVLFVGWILLFNAQISLVATRKLIWHRRLGALMVVWAMSMLVVGPPTVVMAIRRPQSGVGAVEFFGDLGQLVVFVILIGIALLQRRESATHKRLMLLGTAVLMLPALARIPMPLPAFLGLYLLVPVSLIAWDLMTLRRIHRATAVGLGLILLLIASTLTVASTPMWLEFSHWVKSS